MWSRYYKSKKWFQSDLETYSIISEIVSNAEIVNDNIAISIFDKEDINSNVICAKAADELLSISNITASFVIGHLGEKYALVEGQLEILMFNDTRKIGRWRSYYTCRSSS